ncbi:MAG: sugar transferase [Chloroflexota bacterium]
MDSAVAALEEYLRREDTLTAMVLRSISPASGRAYLTSRAKRNLDLAISAPAALLSAPLILLVTLINRMLFPAQPALFIQRRVWKAGSALRVVKIRSMAREKSSAQHVPAKHTSFGRFIRRTSIDELPQFAQVWRGQLTLIGIRILPVEIHQLLERSWSQRRYADWRAVYDRGPLGLSCVHQVFRGAGKDDEKRFHRDLFYAGRASLGFDLYLIWRTLVRIAESIVDST